jgi:subtilisin family serine protease
LSLSYTTGVNFMKFSKSKWLVIILATLCSLFPALLIAADSVRPAYIPQAKSNTLKSRLIIKMKPVHVVAGLSSVLIAAELRRPLSSATMNRLQTTAGMGLVESHALSNGAHVMLIQGSPDRATLMQAIKNIRGLSEVDYIEEDRILQKQLTPNDTNYNSLWGLQPPSPVSSPAPGATGNYGADFQTAWDTNKGSGIVIAIVDTGITPHIDLVGTNGTVSPPTGNLISAGYDFISDCRIRGSCVVTTSDTIAGRTPTPNATDLGDFISTSDSTTIGSFFFGDPEADSSWHGSHVAGIAAALGDNNRGVIGGAYMAKILPVRVLGKGGGYVSDITEGILWATGVHPVYNNPNPAKVINLSLGGSGACSNTEQSAIDAAVAAGAVIVVAAGNEDIDAAEASPANCKQVISVAAIGRDGSRAVYSNTSSAVTNLINPLQVTLAAQGGDQSLTNYDLGILSTVNSGLTTPNLTTGSTYTYYQGTSMATPHVAAAAALMLSRNAALTPAQVKIILAASTIPFPSFSNPAWALYDCATLKNCGAGILNARLAVANSTSPMTAPNNELDFGTVSTDGSVSRTVTFTANTTATLTTTTLTGINANSFSITSNTCTGTVTVASTCQVTVNFSPKAANVNVAGFIIATQASANGAVSFGLTGYATLPATFPSALAAAKNNAGSAAGSSGGGCSISTLGGYPDISLLLAVFALLLYRIRLHFAPTFAKT